MSKNRKKEDPCAGCRRRCCDTGCLCFCKPPAVQKQISDLTVKQKVIEEKVIPYGYVNIFSGVHTAENKFTSPVLAIHLYKTGQEKLTKKTEERSLTVEDDEINLNRESSQAEHFAEKMTSADEVFMLPVEDVLQITYKSDVKQKTNSNINSEIIPEYKLSENCCDRCCASFLGCCDCLDDCCRSRTVAPIVKDSKTIEIGDGPIENVQYHEEDLALPKEKSSCLDCCDSLRCWCCRKKKLVKLVKRIKKTNQQEAERVITVTIEYLVYSNLDSPSNVRLLNANEQKEFFKERFQLKKEIKFYLTHNRDVDSKHFELRSKEAEALCRSIIQLKAMKSGYPSENDLDKVLDQVHRRTFGDLFQETRK